MLPFKPERIGKQWGKTKEKPRGQNTYEIDIVALNKKTRQILFAECKWQNRVNAKKTLKELKEKAQFVQWNNEKRKEFYAVFAKSFKKKTKGKTCLYDLKDLEKALNQTTKTPTRKQQGSR